MSQIPDPKFAANTRAAERFMAPFRAGVVTRHAHRGRMTGTLGEDGGRVRADAGLN